MLRILITFIVLLTSVAFAKDFPVDYMDDFQSGNIDLKNTEWIVTHPAPNRIFLVHSKQRVFALVTEHLSTVPVEKMEEYFAGSFTGEVLLSREKFLRKEEGVIDLQGGSDTHEGVRYGGTSFKVAMDEGVTRFYERMWSEQGKLWHISLVSFESADTELNGDLNYLMEKISKTPVKTSSFSNLFFSEAYASDERCRINESGKWRELSGIMPRVKKETKCNEMNIAAQNRGNGYGIKLDLSSLSGCTQGPAAAWNAMKQSFLSGLSTLANATEQKIKQYGCERLRPPEAKSLWQSITNSFAMQSYTDCLSAAATGAMVSQAWQGIKATLGGIRDLYNWVKAGNNPWSAAVAMVTKEVNGFLCLNAAAQAKVVCEYATHYFIALGMVVATAATGGALAPVAGAGTAARVALAVQRGVSAAKAFIATPYTVTRTIVKTPARIVERGAARAAAKGEARAGLTVSSPTPRPRVTPKPAPQVRAQAQVRAPASTTSRTTPKPKKETSSPAPVVREEMSADELNARTNRESKQQTFNQELEGRNIDLAEAERRIQEVGIEDFLSENGDKFSVADRERLTAIHKELNPMGSTDRLAQLERAAKFTDTERVTEAKSLLGRDLTDAQKEAIIKAHNIGSESGHGFFTYTNQEITAKALALKNAGFSQREIRLLMEKGITGSQAVLDRYDAIRAAGLASKAVDTLKPGLDPAKLNEIMSTIREQNKISAQGFASEARQRAADGDKAYSLVNTGLAIERYIKAGDVEGAMAMINSGLGQGMTKEGIIRSLNQRLTLDKESKRPDLVLERTTFAKIRDSLNPPARPAPQVAVVPPKPVVQPKPPVAPTPTPEVKPAPVPEPVRAPAVAKVVSPREASNLANDYRLGQNGKTRDPNLASQYYMQAGEDNFKKEMVRKKGYNEDSNYLGDRHVYGALTESLAGDGTVAMKMVERLATETKGGHGLNEFIAEMHDLNAFSYKNNPQARANMMKLINSIEQNYKDKLYSPQQSMMRSWRSANDW